METNVDDKDVNDKIERQKEDIEKLNRTMLFVVIVLLMAMGAMFVTVGTLVWNAHLWSADIYRGFIKELDENNDKMEIFYKKLKTYNELKINPKIIEPKAGE